MIFKKLLLFIFINSALTAKGQTNFADKCVGNWEGKMAFYKNGKLLGKMPVKFTVTKKQEENTWTWKTEYISKKYPGIKDYQLKLINAEKQHYILDEGNNTIIQSYAFGNKLYQVFKTEDILLTSSYELHDNTLIFEVTSGKK